MKVENRSRLILLPTSLIFLLFVSMFSCVNIKKVSNVSIVNVSDFRTLQEAFDALPETGGEVIIPPGEYEIFEPLRLTKGNTLIKGSGPATRLINLNQTGKPAVIIKPSDMKPGSFIWRIQLEGFRVSGNSKSGDGLYIQNVNELLITSLQIDHNGKHGINAVHCLENPRINNCNITYNGDAGVYLYGAHDCIVNANQFEENQDALQYIDGFNLTMNGNNIDDHLRHGIVIENTYGSVISGNMIETCAGKAMILDRDCYGITINGNVMTHTGLEFRDAWGCNVSANSFVVMRSFSISVGQNSGRITISGNNFCNSYIGEGRLKRKTDPGKTKNHNALDGGAGIILDNTSDINITGNGFSGLSGEAVNAMGECNRILVSGNSIVDIGRDAGRNTTAIDLDSATESVIQGNIIKND